MGFTLRAALATLGPDAQVVVAELVPEIIDWARGPMARLAAGCPDDPRVGLIIGDVAAAIEAGGDRQSVGWGKSAYVRVDLGCGRSDTEKETKSESKQKK